MSFPSFGNLPFGNTTDNTNNSANGPDTTTPQDTAASTPTQNADNSSQTQPSTTPGQQPTATQENSNPFAALLQSQHAQREAFANADPNEQAAEHFLNAVMQQNSDNNPVFGAPAVNGDLVMEHLQNEELLAGVDLSQLSQAFNLQTPEEQQQLQNVFSQIQRNTIASIIPIINSLSKELFRQATTSSVTTAQHNMETSSIVTAFRNTYPEVSNPLALQMVNNLAQQFVKHVPKGTSTTEGVKAIYALLTGMGSSLTVKPQERNQRGIQTDMSDIFK